MIFYNYTFAVLFLCCFLYHFFPISIDSGENISPPTEIKDVKFDLQQIFKPDIDRLIFVVIDAFRLDFLNANNMPFLSEACNMYGCTFSAKVQAPTVTMPRIKALTVGNVPQFADIIFNLASTEVISDSFLHRAKKSGKRMIFYGDDTWLKLYPNMFLRSEGTSSFFVNDFYEVDDNVTRHLNSELSNEDWEIMILHYLGLDHIGHVYGPNHSLVPPKLQEMDRILQKIYQSSLNWKEKTLIVVTGDHGMKDSGGHGGSTYAEVIVPLVFLGLPCSGHRVDQVDVPVTLSSLMGFEFPMGSIGKLIPFQTFDLHKTLYMLLYNSLILKSKSNKFLDLHQNATDGHYRFLKNVSRANDVIESYEKYLKGVSLFLINNNAKQDISILIICCSIVIVSLIVNFAIIFNKYVIYLNLISFILVCYLLFTFASMGSLHVISSLILFACALIYFLNIIYESFIARKPFYYATYKYKNSDTILLLIIASTALHPLTFLSSSFIEEEHQVWYFFAATALTFLTYHLYSRKKWRDFLVFVFLSSSFCFVRRINQTGNKWAHLTDVSDWLMMPENYYILQMFILFSILVLWRVCYEIAEKETVNMIMLSLVLSVNFTFRIAHSTALVKLMWILIFLLFSYNAYTKSISTIRNITLLWLLMCSMLFRPYNIIFLPFCVYFSWNMLKQLRPINNNVPLITVAQLWLGNILYFSQGHSNSLSSADVSAGYIGLNSYQPFVVITLVLCHTYAFPIMTSLLTAGEITRRSYTPDNDLKRMWCILISYRLINITLVIIICFIQRDHLFIWSVFAPKLLIESSHCVVLLIQIILYNVYSITG